MWEWRVFCLGFSMCNRSIALDNSHLTVRLIIPNDVYCGVFGWENWWNHYIWEDTNCHIFRYMRYCIYRTQLLCFFKSKLYTDLVRLDHVSHVSVLHQWWRLHAFSNTKIEQLICANCWKYQYYLRNVFIRNIDDKIYRFRCSHN